MYLTKDLHGLEQLLNCISVEELKKIPLKDFKLSFVKNDRYSDGLFLTVCKDIWFENKKDAKKKFFISVSIMKGLKEIDYKGDPAVTEIDLNIYGNYAGTSFDGWETAAILHKKTKAIFPLIEKLKEQMEEMKISLKENHTIRLKHLLSDNPPVVFTNKINDTLNRIEEE